MFEGYSGTLTEKIPHHDWSTRYGYLFGKVFIMRHGKVPRDKNGAPIAFGPESATRGDVILDLNLQPLRVKKGKPDGRRYRR